MAFMTEDVHCKWGYPVGGWCRSVGVQVDSHNRNCVVVEDCRDIFGGKLVCCVADEKTGLSNSTVTNDDAPRKGVNLISLKNDCANGGQGNRHAE